MKLLLVVFAAVALVGVAHCVPTVMEEQVAEKADWSAKVEVAEEAPVKAEPVAVAEEAPVVEKADWSAKVEKVAEEAVAEVVVEPVVVKVEEAAPAAVEETPKTEYSAPAPAAVYGARVYPVPISYRAPAYSAPAYAAYDYAPAPYSFGYEVKDNYYNDYAHSENSDGKVVSGSYRVLLPDTRVQTVVYKVDGYSGYVADVQYTGDAKYPEYKAAYSAPAAYYKPAAAKY